LCDDEGIGARSPGDELAAPPAKEEAALIRFSFGRFCIHCSTDVSVWPKADLPTAGPNVRFRGQSGPGVGWLNVG